MGVHELCQLGAVMEKPMQTSISAAVWGVRYSSMKTRLEKSRFRQQFKFCADISSDSHFRNMKDGRRKVPEEALKFACDFFGLSR